MKKNIKKAFTLAEVLVALMIIGFVAVIMIRNISTKDFNKKASIANAYKAFDAVQQASINIRHSEITKCPMESFMVSYGNTHEYVLVNDNGDEATTDDVLTLYSNYLKFDNTSKIFCNLSGYCPNQDILGGRIPGDAIVGFEVTGIIDCPDYYMPENTSIIKGSGKCWGKLYVDTNGKEAPNKLGDDVFIMGLGKDGVIY